MHILEISAKRNGPEKPVTIGHLLNIAKMVDRAEKDNLTKKAEIEERLWNSIEPRDMGDKR